MWKKLPDSLLPGIFGGCISLSLFYCLVASIRLIVVNYYQNSYLFQSPKVFLFSLFLNVVLFRFVLINGEKENIAKGILLATFGVSIVYFYYFFRYHNPIFGL